ncbi:MAG: right-handed parallel beta-helix repeat-containing protein [Clostridia bacterium]|nr:right-handed parallel beta-helix repeat-containing protein [Clostridia bacterium]
MYVATDGDDTNDGTINSPVKSIEKARDIIRSAKITGDCVSNSPVSIVLREGKYEVDSTIEFAGADSGNDLYPLTIKAYKNEKVTISGGKDISASALVSAGSDITSKIIDESARDNIKAVDLSENGVSELGEISLRGSRVSDNITAQAEVSVDGTRLKLAGWPNEGFVGGISEVVRSGNRSTSGINSGSVFKYTGYTRPQQWSEPEKAWISGTLYYNYFYDYYPIESVNGDEITLKRGAVSNSYYSKPFFRFENILEELDSPGEYYIDRDSGMMYIYMPEGSSANSLITVSQTDKNIIEITNADNIRFENIELTGGRASAIVTKGSCSGITVKNCDIHSFGANGVSISGCKYSAVRDCNIYDVGKNGIVVSGGDYKNVASSQNIVYNNNVYNFSQLERGYTSGINVGYQSVGTKIKNNHIHDGPHAGIIFYGVNNEISYNEIDNVVKEFHDMDAIYVNNYNMPWERGNVITHNLFHDIGKETFPAEKQMNVAAIRTDNNGHGLIVKHNAFYDIGQSKTNAVSCIQAQGTHNIIRENMFIDCSETYLGCTKYNSEAKYSFESKLDENGKETNENISIRNNLSTYKNGIYGKLFPEIANFWEEHPASSQTNEFIDNLVVNINLALSTVNDNSDSWQNTDNQGYRAASNTVIANGNFVSNENVGFKDYENKNFELDRNSVVYSMIPGFDYINFSAIGTK